jgi:RNAse (barnase) inhibitor barstar
MSSFKNSSELFKKIDYQIIANGWFQLYLSSAILGNDIGWLENEGYEIIQFECNTENNLFEQFREQFLFPKYFHHNLNSLNDCLKDIETKGIGMAIVFKNADNLKKDILYKILDTFVNMARLNFIIGKRILILVQVNNKDFNIDDIGTIKATWNINEWRDSERK